MNKYLEIEVLGTTLYYFSIEELFSIVIGLTILFIVLAIVLAHIYKTYRKKKDTLTAEISGFESKGYNVDINKNDITADL